MAKLKEEFLSKEIDKAKEGGEGEWNLVKMMDDGGNWIKIRK